MSFFDDLARSLERNRITRRQALWLLGAGAAAGLSGCATSPVTGETILVGMSEAQEKQTDAQVAPHQFSQDLGAIQDEAVNRYVAGIGQRMGTLTHRPQMPYSYRVLNANYVNAYTFPGGAMGVTRGILADLDDEAQLAALLGHELGHVNARHAAQRQGQNLVAQAALAGLNVAAQSSDWGGLMSMGGQIGASALLAGYSREHEREADALGQEYLVKAGYPATGMVRLHQLLVAEEKSAPSLLQTMFSTHPMSSERMQAAQAAADARYRISNSLDARRERFMDSTASLRRIRPTIDACKNGETAMAARQYPKAQAEFQTALARTPRDYASNLRMAQCLQAQGQTAKAVDYADNAREIYPQEAQAYKLAGVLALQQRDAGRAYQNLDRFDRLLPGDAGITFLKGISLEGMGNRQAAAQHYAAYLRQSQQGNAAQYSYNRLKAWGMVK
ncbi:M48 family metalloprotease [Thauera aminoaromatica]|jgi:predicted Zn-dependent protease|uniref:Peptidase M48 Ste24p n=1 Tax=Thauera aminoaromatica TaxID=164330 RepID=C4ZJX1_THASP|nr:M48 family metalloprotease [Thauera aminoaromatica]ACK54962.1 peptidase M48 Ste24p [Thauera aminoaromatica]MCK6398168.1 M48 family metalloprotease [Thauera aminoaromatica]HNV89425.1 M48 family metalloprotease [Thauera aminoaromatica]